MNIDVSNEEQLNLIKKNFREEISKLYENLDEENIEDAFSSYYQLNHLINQLDQYHPQLDYSVKE